MKKLDIQVFQTAASFKRQDGFLSGRIDNNPKRFCNAILIRDGNDVWEKEESGDNFEAVEQVSDDTSDWCRSTPMRFPAKSLADQLTLSR